MLLNGARMNEKQRVSILAASVTSMLIETTSLFGNFSASSTTSGTVGARDRDENKQQPTLFSWTPPSTAVYLKHIQLSAVASFIRQSEGPSTSKRETPPSVNVATVHSGYTGGRERGKDGGKCNGKKTFAAELAKAKLTNPCRRCGKVGHWADAHNPDASLKPRTPRFDPEVILSSGNHQSGGTSNNNTANNNNAN